MDILLEILHKHRLERELLTAKSYVRREQAAKLSQCLASEQIKVVVGPRRAGKSSLIFDTLREHSYAYVNFEDDALRSFTGDQIVEALEVVYKDYKIIFFDEIQEYEGWNSFLNKLQRRGQNLVVTGSNSEILESELSSSLTGRHLPIEIFPYSLKEYCNANEIACDLSALKSYLKQGGFPALSTHEPDKWRDYITLLFDAIIYRDVVIRNKIYQREAIQGLVALLLNSIGSRFSYRNAHKYLGQRISVNTIHKYINLLSNAYLFYELASYGLKAKARLRSSRKVYCIDPAIIQHVGVPIIESWSNLLENAVFLELMRRVGQINRRVFYYETKSGREIDFLTLDAQGQRDLFQVAIDISAPETLEREIKALEDAAADFPVKSMTLITLNQERVIPLRSGIVSVVPYWKWVS
jgi:predicted AAA+ superfamily ATPase